MTLSSTWMVSSNTSDATWRTWASAMNTLITGAGLVYVPCTGDMQFTDEIRPTAGYRAGNTAGDNYRIYRFNDTLQATYPVFFKIYFGTGAGANTYAGIYISMGMVVNTDTGVLSGNGYNIGWAAQLPNYTTNAGGYYISSGPDLDCFTFAFGANQGSSYDNQYMSIVTIERVPDGILILNYCGQGPQYRCGYITYTGTPYPLLTTNGIVGDNVGQFAPLVPGVASTLIGSNYALYPGRTYCPHASYFSKQLMFYLNSEITQRTSFTVDGVISGQQRTYYAIGPAYSTNYYNAWAMSSPVVGLAMAWD